MEKGDIPEDANEQRMSTVKHKILVLGGKAGVGKSTFAAQLSFALASMNFSVGLVDTDKRGSSIPKMLGLEGQEIRQSNFGWSPIYKEDNLAVMSVGFMVPNSDDAVIGPRKNSLIKQFLEDVNWGEIDYLVVDTPVGTSDELSSIVQYLLPTGIDGAIIVTTPHELSIIGTRNVVNFCKNVGLRVLGVVENMSGLSLPVTDFKFMKQLPETGSTIDVTQDVISYMRENLPEFLDCLVCTDMFGSSSGGVERTCKEMEVPLLGKVAVDPELCTAGDQGQSCFAEANKCLASAPALKSIVQEVLSTMLTE